MKRKYNAIYLKKTILVLILFHFVQNTFNEKPQKPLTNFFLYDRKAPKTVIVTDKATRESSEPFYRFPCRMDIDNQMGQIKISEFGELSSAYRAIALQTRIALLPLYAWQEEFLKWYSSYNLDHDMDIDKEWKEIKLLKSLPSFPLIPKELGEELNATYYSTPFGVDPDYMELKSYEALSMMSASWEFAVWWQIDLGWPFGQRWKAHAYILKTLLCDLLYIIIARGYYPATKYVSRKNFTRPAKFTYGFARRTSVLAYRDIINTLEYIFQCFDYQSCISAHMYPLTDIY